MIEGAGGIIGLIGKLLEFFQQKAYVYVDVTFGDEKPYRLTVFNNSKFDIHLNEMNAAPDGFKPESVSSSHQKQRQSTE